MEEVAHKNQAAAAEGSEVRELAPTKCCNELDESTVEYDEVFKILRLSDGEGTTAPLECLN